jgi:outer membrane protein assembly factor BamB
MKRITTALFFISIGFLTIKAQTHPWQMVHGTAQRTGYANVVGPQTAYLKWKYNIGGFNGGENSVAISSTGRIYVGGANNITCVDRNGNLKWSKPYYGAEGPCISNNGHYIYFVADTGIICIDSNGTFQWTYVMPQKGIFGPTLSKDGTMLYQGCWDHYVYCISSAGAYQWKYLTYGCVSYPSALTPGGKVIVGGGDAHCGADSCIYALNPSNGALLWKYVTNSLHCGGPAVGRNGLIYVPAQPAVYVLDTNGNFQWKEGAPFPISGIITPALYNDTTSTSAVFYVGNSAGRFFSVSSSTHDTTWGYATGQDPNTHMTGLPAFPVVDKQGDVYFGAADYKVYALNKNGTVLWTYTTGGEITEASPALDKDGTLYITSADGYLYALGHDPSSVNDVEAFNSALHIVPNPAQNRFKVTSDHLLQTGTILNLYSIAGQLVYHVTLETKTQTIEIQSLKLTNGIYLLQLQAPTGGCVNKKIEIIN